MRRKKVKLALTTGLKSGSVYLVLALALNRPPSLWMAAACIVAGAFLTFLWFNDRFF